MAADATSGALNTMTLPTAAGITGQTYTIKKIDSTANTVTIACTGGQTIDGATTQFDQPMELHDRAEQRQ